MQFNFIQFASRTKASRPHQNTTVYLLNRSKLAFLPPIQCINVFSITVVLNKDSFNGVRRLAFELDIQCVFRFKKQQARNITRRPTLLNFFS